MSSGLSRVILRALVSSFRLPYLYAHLLAIAITALLCLTGVDWWFFEHTRISTVLTLTTVAGIIGFFVPLLVPLALFILGAQEGSRPSLKSTAWIILLAEGVSWVLASFYKVFTGRTQPEFLTHFNTIDISRDFHFGFLQHGIFWGWPSAHAATACAMAVILCRLFPEMRGVRYGAVVYAVYMTLGAAIGFHWLSDALAGALLGTAVGLSVIRTMRT